MLGKWHVGISLDGRLRQNELTQETLTPASVEATRLLYDPNVPFLHICNNVPGLGWAHATKDVEVVPTISRFWKDGPEMNSGTLKWKPVTRPEHVGSVMAHFLRSQEDAHDGKNALSLSVMDHLGMDGKLTLARMRVLVAEFAQYVYDGLLKSGKKVTWLLMRIVTCGARLLARALFEVFRRAVPNVIAVYSSGEGEVDVGTEAYDHRDLYASFQCLVNAPDEMFVFRDSFSFTRNELHVGAEAGRDLGARTCQWLLDRLGQRAEEQRAMMAEAVADALNARTQAGRDLLRDVMRALQVAEREARALLGATEKKLGRPGALVELAGGADLGSVRLGLFGMTGMVEIPASPKDECEGSGMAFDLCACPMQDTSEIRDSAASSPLWGPYDACRDGKGPEAKDLRGLAVQGLLSLGRRQNAEFQSVLTDVIGAVDGGPETEAQSWHYVVLGALMQVWDRRCDFLRMLRSGGDGVT